MYAYPTANEVASKAANPPRTVWADETQKKLDDINRRKAELASEEKQAKEMCNHTSESGHSLIKFVYDDYGSGSHHCAVCGTRL